MKSKNAPNLTDQESNQVQLEDVMYTKSMVQRRE